MDRGHRSPSIYSRTERIEKKSSYKWLYILLLIVLVLSVCYLIFVSPFLKITKVEINNLKYLDKDQILNKEKSYSDALFINNNLLTYYTSGLRKQIMKIDGVSSVKISRNFPNTLEITVGEKVPSMTWETLGSKYLVDPDGTVFAPYEDKFKDIPTIVDTKNVPAEIGKSVVSPDFCSFVNDLAKNFQEMSGTTITKIEVPEITDEIKVTTKTGWYVLFDTTRTAKSELTSLSRVISEVTSKKRKLEYVDLRIDNKIFYK